MSETISETPQQAVARLELDNARLRERLRDYWRQLHDEHCHHEWPHPTPEDERLCGYPPPSGCGIGGPP